MFRPLSLLLILGPACAGPDQGFGGWSDVGAPGEQAWIPQVNIVTTDPLPTDEIDPVYELDLHIDVALQRNRFGDFLGRCHLQIAFRYAEEQTEPDGPGPNPGQGPDQVIEVPTVPNTCAYTNLERTEPTEPGQFEPGEEPELDSEEEEEEDNWQMRGDIASAEAIYLTDEWGTLTLERTELTEERVRYELIDCDEDSFPFDTVFDLTVPAVEDGEVPGFTVPDAFVVGHDVMLMAPFTEEDFLRLGQDAPLEVSWENLGPRPQIGDQMLVPVRTIWLRNHEEDVQEPFEALACLPPEDKMVIPPFALRHLQPNPGVDEQWLRTAFQFDTVYHSPAFIAPWGQAVHVRSTVSDGGDLHFY